MSKKTHLYEYHSAHGKITDFAGFSMPLWYKGIITEHMAVRRGVGIFDVSHMGRALISEPEAEEFLNYVTTNDVSSLKPLSAQYSTMCNEKGGIIDDFVVSRLEEDRFLMVYNASNREKDYAWLKKHSEGFNVEVKDVSDQIAMFAVQGPYAEETLQQLSTQNLSEVGRFKCIWTEISECKIFASRTGYTGEDGFEIFVWNTTLEDPTKAVQVWNNILKAGEKFGIEPCGLGARDTLRLEAGMCLYGNDIDESTTPIEARISFVVKLNKGEFIGREVLERQKSEGVKRVRVGIKIAGRGIPRPGHKVLVDGREVGYVTSGTLSPLLNVGIAMAYLPKELSEVGGEVEVNIRDRLVKGLIVKLPFYRRVSPDTVYVMGNKIQCPINELDKLKDML